MSELKFTQKWMQEVITHPNGIVKGAQSAVIENEYWSIDSIVSPSKNQTSEERLNVYCISYFARLLECFRQEYKGLLSALGEEMFKHLAWSFLQAHPSTSYTLNALGKKFPTYLESTLHESLDGKLPDSWQLFIVDMAKYERLYTEVYNGEGHETMLTDDVFGLASVKLSPSVKTLQLRFPIAECIEAFRKDETRNFPEIEPSIYVFSRDQYRVNVSLVDNEEWSALMQWVKDPDLECPLNYRDKWLVNGIGYS